MKRPRIVFLDAKTLGDVSLYRLTKLGNLTGYQVTPPELRINRIDSNEIVITNKVLIDREVMDACPTVKLICIAATGMNNIDLDYATEKGIIVKNVAGYSSESVVQLTFSLLFYILNKTRYFDDYVKSGNYARSVIFTHHGQPFGEVAGKRFGIIGMGTIGKRVAEVASAFKADVVYYSTSGENLNSGFNHVPLNTLLTGCDIISIHCPLTNSTKNLIDYNQLKLMKKNAVLINAGRGGIVNEEALARALNEDLIAGAGLDVLEKEPPEESNPLFHINHPEKLIITPHIAWASVEARERLVDGIVSNITAYINQIE